MRNYSKVGGKKGKPGYRTPKSFFHKFVKITNQASRQQMYAKLKSYFAKKAK